MNTLIFDPSTWFAVKNCRLMPWFLRMFKPQWVRAKDLLKYIYVN